MLLYNSLRAQTGRPQPEAESQLLVVSELLELITVNHYRSTAECFQALEQQGIFLGNGGFLSAVVWRYRGAAFQYSDLPFLRKLLEEAEKHLHAPVWYAYTCQGRLCFLFCYPRVQPSKEAGNRITGGVLEDFAAFRDRLRELAPELRVMVGNVDFGEQSIYLTANALNHAVEYVEFRREQFQLLHPVMEDQLYKAFVTDFSAYRKFAIQLTDRLISPTCNLTELVNSSLDTILLNCAPSIESLHHHLQIFMLTFTDYLGSSGVVNASFLARHQITSRIMHFESEEALRRQLQELLTEILRQHHTLSGVGKQQRILEIRDYVNQQLSDPELTVNQVADRFSVAPSLLTSQFRHYFGITLHQYIQRERQRLARDLLVQDPSLTLQQAATAAGYTDVSTMYRAFRKFEGISPGVLKK